MTDKKGKVKRLTDVGEFGLIGRIEKLASQKKEQLPGGLVVDIGDDAAAFDFDPKLLTVATTDVLIENVHFKRAWTSLKEVGWKAIAVNVSDIAAMGAEPRFALVSIAVSKKTDLKSVDLLYRGMAGAASTYGLKIAGGDTSSTRSGLYISVTVLGQVRKHKLIQRDGAVPEDTLVVTSTVGAAHAGLRVLQKGLDDKKFPYVVRKHRTPKARLEESLGLNKLFKIHSMIDVSDGLVSDLQHLCEKSGVGAVIEAKELPMHRQTVEVANHLRENPMKYALHGGEDYELLFTMKRQDFEVAKKVFRRKINRVGEITKKKGIVLVDENGKPQRIKPEGFDHFG